MGQDVRFIIVHRDDSFAVQMRAMLSQIEGVKIVAEVDEPGLLAQVVKQCPVDIVLVDLDPSPESILAILADVLTATPPPVLFAASASTDGPLILKAMRMGIREFLPKPLEANALREAIEKVAVQRPESGRTGKLITVMGTAGGVGATTLTANLGVELAGLTDRGVTVVDLDYRYGQVATLLDVEPTYTLADLCASPEQLESQVVTRALTKHLTGVQVLSRPSNFVEADGITAPACVGVLSTLLQMNEHVVTDGPSRFDSGAQSLLALSDVNLLVVQLLIPCVRNALRILDTLRHTGYNLDRMRLICNRMGRDSGHLTVENVSETLNLPVFATIPDDWGTVSGAINLGEPLKIYGPKSKVRLAIQEIAERLHTPEEQADDKDARKKGLIGRIFATS